MSGIVGFVHLDGLPADRQQLARMTSFLTFRGPDALQMWSDGAIGLGHALLRTTDESAREHQPLTLDQQVWIVADARIDAREELVRELAAKGRPVPPSAPDVEFILHAYHEWGEDCVEHLLGDFCFAIWDARHQRLFCARDHFGVKPLFYAHVGDLFLFSNTLRCLRMHPIASDQLNEVAVADLLLFGFNQELDATAFSAIRRLPPAHTLTVAPKALRKRRFWTLPVEDPFRYRDAREYIHGFREVFQLAVKDRLRTSSVGILMSGGLDSPTVAAFSKSALAQSSSSFDLRGYTTVFDRLLPDRERHFSEVAAKALGVLVDHRIADNCQLFADWRKPERRPPEPINDPLLGIHRDQLKQVATGHRLALTGQGGDPVFSTSVLSYAARLLKGGQYVTLLSDFLRFLVSEGRLSRLYLHTRFRLLREKRRSPAPLPPWLNRDFSRRLDLEGRWRSASAQSAPAEALRPSAFHALQSPAWPSTFEGYDPALTLVPVECRHPFFDVRLVRFLLRVPPVPWCTDKELVRVAMRGILPEEIRLRPKTPLAGEPARLLLRRSAARWWEDLPRAAQLATYVDCERIPRPTGKEAEDQVWQHLAPHCLNLWLLSLHSQ